VREFVVETNLLHAKLTWDFSIMCKAVNMFQNPAMVAALDAKSSVYLALWLLQGCCILKVYGYFNIWGILHLLALENIGQTISDGPISSSLHQKIIVSACLSCRCCLLNVSM